jgi:hypothetical protein
MPAGATPWSPPDPQGQGSQTIKPGPDPTFDGGKVVQGEGLTDEQTQKARAGGTIKMGPKGPYVE